MGNANNVKEGNLVQSKITPHTSVRGGGSLRIHNRERRTRGLSLMTLAKRGWATPREKKQTNNSSQSCDLPVVRSVTDLFEEEPEPASTAIDFLVPPQAGPPPLPVAVSSPHHSQNNNNNNATEREVRYSMHCSKHCPSTCFLLLS